MEFGLLFGVEGGDGYGGGSGVLMVALLMGMAMLMVMVMMMAMVTMVGMVGPQPQPARIARIVTTTSHSRHLHPSAEETAEAGNLRRWWRRRRSRDEDEVSVLLAETTPLYHGGTALLNITPSGVGWAGSEWGEQVGGWVR